MFSFLGVARPMTRLNGALGRMAGGDLDVEIPGAGRGDEIGDLAKTVTVIRENAEHKAREEAEAKVKQAQAAARRRKQEMIKLADDFEGAVGNIVETVSSASTQLEASAGTLTLAVLGGEPVGVGLRAEDDHVRLELLDLGHRPVLELLAQHGRSGVVVEPGRRVGAGTALRTRKYVV